MILEIFYRGKNRPPFRPFYEPENVFFFSFGRYSDTAVVFDGSRALCSTSRNQAFRPFPGIMAEPAARYTDFHFSYHTYILVLFNMKCQYVSSRIISFHP